MTTIDFQNISLKKNERIDDLQRAGYHIIQNSEKFCFGMDAVLLSGYTKVKKGEKVIDLGTGTGIIPILLCAKTEGSHFTGLEIQEESAEMASRSVLMNGIEDKVSIVRGDIKEASRIFGRESADVVTSNPPYMIGSDGLKGDNDEINIARHEIMCTLDDVVSEASYLLKHGGRLYMVHRPFRLVEIFDAMRKYHLEPKRMQLVHPFIDKEPNMVLIEALKGGRPRLTVDKPLIVYKEQGVYTKDIFDIYGY